MHNALAKTHRLSLKGVGRCAFLFRDYFFVDVFDFVCKVTFIECGCNFFAVSAGGFTPFRILQDRIQQRTEFAFCLIFISVAAFDQDFVQTGIPSAQQRQTVGGSFYIG